MSNNFDQSVKALFDGMDQVFSTKTVVGEPQIVGETIIVPLMDVSFGMGAGALGKTSKSDTTGGGIGGKMSPSAILVIQNGDTRLVPVKSQDAVTKILDMVPPTVNKVTSLIKSRGQQDPEVEAVIAEEKKTTAVREEI